MRSEPWQRARSFRALEFMVKTVDLLRHHHWNRAVDMVCLLCLKSPSGSCGTDDYRSTGRSRETSEEEMATVQARGKNGLG